MNEATELLIGDWHRNFIAYTMKETGCSIEQARSVLGAVIEMRNVWEQGAFARGFNAK